MELQWKIKVTNDEPVRLSKSKQEIQKDQFKVSPLQDTT